MVFNFKNLNRGHKELTKTCPNCGKENVDNAKFCKTCGTNLDNIKNIKKSNTSKSTSGGLLGWWNKRSTNGKALSGFAACCIGLFLLILVVGALAPETTNLSISSVNAQIDNKTTEYIINGTAEPGAKIYISSCSLNLTKVEATVDKTGNFQYKLKVPINITDLSVEVSAVAPEKIEASQTVKIQRPLIPLTINPTPTLTEDNKTVTIEGTTDPNAEVKITSSELGLNETKINADSNGKFKYTVKVPSNVYSASVSITAKSAGKRVNTQTESIIRESPPPATTETSTDTTSSSGSSSSSSSSTGSSSSSSESYGSYIANANTGVFHYSWCHYVDRMNEENKVPYSSSKAADNAGYRPCKVCNP